MADSHQPSAMNQGFAAGDQTKQQTVFHSRVRKVQPPIAVPQAPKTPHLVVVAAHIAHTTAQIAKRA